MKLAVVTFAIAILTPPALAQSESDALAERWGAANQVYVTKKVREYAHKMTLEEETRLAAPQKGREVKVEPIDERRDRIAPLFDRWLARFPTVHLVVQQTPPRDYTVAINGEACPATERGLYKVPGGNVEVQVVRLGKPPCVWNGFLELGRTQEVSCNFEASQRDWPTSVAPGRD
jgi:hypothetical protein